MTKGVSVQRWKWKADEKGEDLITGRNKEVIVGNIILNTFNRKV